MIDERLSKLQGKILVIMFKELIDSSWATFRNDKGESTNYLYKSIIYTILRKELKIHKLTTKERLEKEPYLQLKMMSASMMDRDRLLNQWDDSCLKVSFSRAIKNMREKELIKQVRVKRTPSDKLICFTKKGIDKLPVYYKKKYKI